MNFRVWFSRLFALSVYFGTRLFYRFEVTWVKPPPENVWENVSSIAILNHTSLLEPLLMGGLPLSFLWHSADRTTVPGADITLNRPLAGFFFRAFSPGTIPITRKRDDSWQQFLSQIDDHSMVVMTPEGRMMRANGLDKDGKPMTVRGGIGDILKQYGHGKFLIIYSGGLHHINLPGSWKVNLFKTIKMRIEYLDIAEYLAGFNTQVERELRLKVARDLEQRLKQYKP